MSAFADTSGLYALIVRTDGCHEAAVREFRRLIEAPRPIWTTSYVLVETEALLQSRIGLSALRDLEGKILPLLTVEWVGKELHAKGVTRILREDRRRLGLVDCVSFEFMRTEGLQDVLGADPHFEEAGFHLLIHA
jgi:uncharacterized protein